MSEERSSINPWQCEPRVFDAPEASALDQLHVGDKYLMFCQGDFVQGLSAENVQLQPVAPEVSYGIVLLNVRTLDGKALWAEATSYKPGPQKFADYQLVSGAMTIPLTGKELTIQSVLAQKPPEEMNHPDAMKMVFMGPFALGMPLWYWALWIAAVVLGLGLLFRWIWNRAQRRKFLATLARKATALTPYNQFNKELRQYLRDYSDQKGWEAKAQEAVSALDKTFRLYLLREFLVPADERKSGPVLREIRWRHKKMFRLVGPQLRRILIELDRAKEFKGTPQFADYEQLRDMCRRTVDQIEKLKRLKK